MLATFSSENQLLLLVAASSITAASHLGEANISPVSTSDRAAVPTNAPCEGSASDAMGIQGTTNTIMGGSIRVLYHCISQDRLSFHLHLRPTRQCTTRFCMCAQESSWGRGWKPKFERAKVVRGLKSLSRFTWCVNLSKLGLTWWRCVCKTIQ